LPTQEPERYISRRELAALMGIHPTTVDKLVKKGGPSVTWGLRTRRFKASVFLAWAKAQGQDSGSPTERSSAA
jgi:excisionase family DNA binding protein